MILAAYGVAGMGPAEMSGLLASAELSHGLYIGGGFTQRKFGVWQSPIPVVFSGIRTFMRSKHKLRKPGQRFVAFVIDTPTELACLTGCAPLGYERLTRHLVRFNELGKEQIIDVLLRPYLEEEAMLPEFEFKPPQVLQQVVGLFKDSSILPALQTLMYKIKNQDQRTKASNLVKQWLSTPMAYSEFQRKLRKAVDPTIYLKYCILLDTPDFKRLKIAVIAAKKNPLAYKRIAAKHKVADFDLKYLLKTGSKK